MSKVKGNVLNPLELIEQYGTDALRFALSTGTAPGNDTKLSTSKLEAGRNFANKLWNATRFVIRSIEPDSTDMEIRRSTLPVEDRWILSRLSRTVSSATRLMEDFQFGEAQRQIYDFLWGEFCDWYIEFAKIRLTTTSELPSPVPILVYVLETSLRLLHPYLPFVTEELWQNLKKRPGGTATESIMIAPYPEADESAIEPQAEEVMETIIEIIRAIRNTRAQYKVASTHWVEAQIHADTLISAISPYAETIQRLARVRPVTFLNTPPAATASENAVALVLKQVQVIIPMESMADLEAERKRLQKDVAQSEDEITRLQTRLNNKDFMTKAPAAVIERERQKLQMLNDKLEKLRQQTLKF